MSSTMTLNFDDACTDIINEASKAMGLSKSDFIRQAIKFSATANALWVQHPQAQTGVCGPKAFPALLKLDYYAWVPLWTPKANSIVIDFSKVHFAQEATGGNS